MNIASIYIYDVQHDFYFIIFFFLHFPGTKILTNLTWLSKSVQTALYTRGKLIIKVLSKLRYESAVFTVVIIKHRTDEQNAMFYLRRHKGCSRHPKLVEHFIGFADECPVSVVFHAKMGYEQMDALLNSQSAAVHQLSSGNESGDCYFSGIVNILPVVDSF